MAEDDDEEGFGDFKFAAYKTHNSSSDNQMNGRNSSVTDDDDDWGDFIDHSPQIGKAFQSANGFSFSQSSRNPSEASHLSNLSGVQSSGIELGKEKWVKPQGALPLSIFGEEEEEVKEESHKSASNTDISENSMAAKINIPVEKGINSRVDVGIDDMISTFFSKNQKIETGNELIWNSNGNSSNSKSNLNLVNPEIPLYTSYNGWNSNMNDLNGANLSTELTSNSDLRFLEVNANRVSFNNNNLISNLVKGHKDFYEADDDDDGWEFKAADMKATNGKMNSEDEPKVTFFHPSSEELFNINGTQTPSTMVSHKSGEWDFGSEFNSGFVEKETTMSDAHPQNKLNDIDKDTTNCLTDENVESNDNFGEFSEAVVNQTQKDEDLLSEDLFRINGTQAPTVISHKSGEWDFGLNFNPGFVEKESTMSDTHPQNKLNDMDKGLNSYIANGNVESDDSFGEFNDAFSDQTQKEPNVPYFHQSGEGTPTPSTMISHKSGEWNFELNFSSGSVVKETNVSDAHPQNKFNDIDKIRNSYLSNGNVESDDNFVDFSEAFPDHSQKINEELFANNTEEPNFRDGKLKNHNILISPDISKFKTRGFGNISQTTVSSTSIHDLISSLYSESELKKSSDLVKAQHGEHIISTILETGAEADDNDFDEESWEFKDASLNFDVQDPISVINLEILPTQSSSKAELNDFLILYCKLKFFLSSLAFGLLENFEDTEAEAIDEEIQKFMNDLMQDKVISDDVQSKSLSPSLDELLDLLQQPKFQVLESEYHVSNKLLMVENDLTSAVELLRYTTSTLRILESESVQTQSIYVSSWFKMLSVCAQELRHGVLIWNESLQNSTHGQILSEPQGRNNILALGEIYRVVTIIGASVKLYKPWTLLGYVDHTSLFSLLTECSTLWSSSGLSEALLSSSILNDLEIKTVVHSIKYIQDLDEFALQNHLLSGEKLKCHLSALTVEMVPGMNMVDWNEVQYFVKLANLWANLISRDPPFSSTQM